MKNGDSRLQGGSQGTDSWAEDEYDVSLWAGSGRLVEKATAAVTGRLASQETRRDGDRDALHSSRRRRRSRGLTQTDTHTHAEDGREGGGRKEEREERRGEEKKRR